MTSLVKKIDQRLQAAMGKTPRALGVYVLFEGNGSNGLERQIRWMTINGDLKRVSLCIGGPPPDYQVSGEAAVTVVIYNPARRGEQKVTANFALREGELDEAKADAILKALTDVMPK